MLKRMIKYVMYTKQQLHSSLIATVAEKSLKTRNVAAIIPHRRDVATKIPLDIIEDEKIYMCTN